MNEERWKKRKCLFQKKEKKFHSSNLGGFSKSRCNFHLILFDAGKNVNDMQMQ